MADNVGYTPGAGATVAADDIGGVLHQRVKIGVGADGSATDVSSANPMPVADDNSGNLLLRILQMLMAPLGYDKSLARQRGTVVVESGSLSAVSTVTTVTTVATVTNVATVANVANVAAVANIAGIGNYSAQMQILDGNRANWALSVRSRIT